MSRENSDLVLLCRAKIDAKAQEVERRQRLLKIFDDMSDYEQCMTVVTHFPAVIHKLQSLSEKTWSSQWEPALPPGFSSSDSDENIALLIRLLVEDIKIYKLKAELVKRAGKLHAMLVSHLAAVDVEYQQECADHRYREFARDQDEVGELCRQPSFPLERSQTPAVEEHNRAKAQLIWQVGILAIGIRRLRSPDAFDQTIFDDLKNNVPDKEVAGLLASYEAPQAVVAEKLPAAQQTTAAEQSAAAEPAKEDEHRNKRSKRQFSHRPPPLRLSPGPLFGSGSAAASASAATAAAATGSQESATSPTAESLTL